MREVREEEEYKYKTNESPSHVEEKVRSLIAKPTHDAQLRLHTGHSPKPKHPPGPESLCPV